MIKFLGAWLIIDGVGSVVWRKASMNEILNDLKEIPTWIRLMRIMAGLVLIGVG